VTVLPVLVYGKHIEVVLEVKEPLAVGEILLNLVIERAKPLQHLLGTHVQALLVCILEPNVLNVPHI